MSWVYLRDYSDFLREVSSLPKAEVKAINRMMIPREYPKEVQDFVSCVASGQDSFFSAISLTEPSVEGYCVEIVQPPSAPKLQTAMES